MHWTKEIPFSSVAIVGMTAALPHVNSRRKPLDTQYAAPSNEPLPFSLTVNDVLTCWRSSSETHFFLNGSRADSALAVGVRLCYA